jgi:hypothetical protein
MDSTLRESDMAHWESSRWGKCQRVQPVAELVDSFFQKPFQQNQEFAGNVKIPAAT